MKIPFKLNLPILLLASAILLASCAEDTTAPGPGDDAEPVTGMIYQIEGTRILVVDGITDVKMPSEEWFEQGFRAVYFAVEEDTVIESESETMTFYDLAPGMKVEVYHEGALAESYPEQGKADFIKVMASGTPAAVTDSGRFMRQIEPGVIEVKISGVPDEHAARVFHLSERAIPAYETLNLKAEEVILFQYIPVGGDDGMIIEIERLEN